MQTTQNLQQDINNFLSSMQSDPPSCRANAYRLLHHGVLSGSGKIVILPVDQGFEHGPDRSFSSNPLAYDPAYHIKLAIDAGLSGYAAPLGMLEYIARDYAGMIPLILKLNSSNMLKNPHLHPRQAVTASVMDALRLGCLGVGFTIYPGSDNFDQSLEIICPMISQAKQLGLLVFIWSYPRGAGIPAGMNSALDVSCYAAHMAALLGAHVIKVKMPDNVIAIDDNKKHYHGDFSHPSRRVSKVMESAFISGKMVLFSGGNSKSLGDVFSEVQAIKDGGGTGSIIGRNTFQRSYGEAIAMLNEITRIYSS